MTNRLVQPTASSPTRAVTTGPIVSRQPTTRAPVQQGFPATTSSSSPSASGPTVTKAGVAVNKGSGTPAGPTPKWGTTTTPAVKTSTGTTSSGSGAVDTGDTTTDTGGGGAGAGDGTGVGADDNQHPDVTVDPTTGVPSVSFSFWERVAVGAGILTAGGLVAWAVKRKR